MRIKTETCSAYDGIVFSKQLFHLGPDILRRSCVHAANLVGQFLVISDGKPIEAGIGGSVFQNGVQLLDERLAWSVIGIVDNHINALEMVGGLDHIVNLDRPVRYADGVRLEDIARLIVGQATALHVVGVIGQVDLDFMINAAVQLYRFFGLQHRKKCLWCIGFLVNAIGLLCGFGYVPCLAGQKCTVDFSFGAIPAHAAFGNAPPFRRFRDRNIFHSEPSLSVQ